MALPHTGKDMKRPTPLLSTLLVIALVVFVGHQTYTNEALELPSAGGTDSANKALGSKKQFAAALATLGDLEVKGRAPKTSYDRDEFGPEWTDLAGDFPYTGNSCDTRNDLLRMALTKITLDSDGCLVLEGILPFERYTGQENVRYVFRDDYKFALDIEHVVPLLWAWQHGAQQWSPGKRAAFANAPHNFPADPSSNRSHKESGPGAWLPPHKPYRCAYIADWVDVLDEWGLWVNPSDQEAMERILIRCIA